MFFFQVFLIIIIMQDREISNGISKLKLNDEGDINVLNLVRQAEYKGVSVTCVEKYTLSAGDVVTRSTFKHDR